MAHHFRLHTLIITPTPGDFRPLVLSWLANEQFATDCDRRSVFPLLTTAGPAGLSSITGQARAIETLRAAVARRRLHHALLFEGPSGVGKATTARALAMALNCERGPHTDGCGECAPCQKILSGNHPDLVGFDMTGKGLTERVRELLPSLGFRPHEARARVVVLDPADDLAQGRAEAANALLKTLEEPPADTHFVLCTAQPHRLPVTVRSRCQRVRFSPLDRQTIVHFLTARQGAELAVAEEAAALADGSLGRALERWQSSERGPAPDRIEALVAAAQSGDAQRIFAAAGELGGDREAAGAEVEALFRALRGRLLDETAGPTAAPLSALRGWPESALLVGIAAAQEAAEALKGNVAPSLAIEHLLLRMAPLAGGR
jgi:DNA polymerase III delta' subunit